MDVTTIAVLVVGLVCGLVVGAIAGMSVQRSRSAVRFAAADGISRDAVSRLEESRRAQSLLREELDSRSSVESLLAPVSASLLDVERQIRESERAGIAAQAALREQVTATRQASEDLRRETSVLTTALRSPHVRGRWGEQQLERIVELAGMVRHCDFTTQSSVRDDDGLTRPDLVVHLAGGKHVVVDAKVPFAAYLDGTETADEAVRRQRSAAHARHVRDHITKLSGKSYWERLTPTPEFVVMFVPAEAFLVAALDEDPTLLEYGFARNVVVATPSTLIALLRTVAYTWRHEAVTDNARQVLALGRELHSRLASVAEHVTTLGRSLGSAVGAYNRAVGSLETRVLVTTRRLAEMELVDEPVAAPPVVTELPRLLSAPELDHERRSVPALLDTAGASADVVSLRRPRSGD